MTITRAAFRNSYNPVLMKNVMDGFNRFPEDWRKMVTVRSSTKEFETLGFMSSLGLPAIIPEGTNMVFDDPIDGFTKKWVHKKKGLGIKITEEARDDDLFGNMKKMAKELGVSAQEGINIDVFSIFNLGTDATKFTAGDGKAVFADDHVRLDGSSYDNLYATTSLSVDALQDDVLKFEALRDHRGKIINRKNSCRLVVCNSANEWKLKEIFGSNYNVDVTDTTGNQFTINALRETRKMMPMTTQYVTSATNRYYLGEKDDVRGIIYFNRQSPTMNQWEVDETGDYCYSVKFRNSIECCDPMNVALNGS